MLTEKQELQFYQRCQISSHPSQATPNALDCENATQRRLLFMHLFTTSRKEKACRDVYPIFINSTPPPPKQLLCN